MKLKKIVMSVTKDDIFNLLRLQDKIEIIDIIINEGIEVFGEYEFFNMKIKFQLKGEFSKIEDNNIYVIINNFKILKIDILNSISKKVFNYVLKAFTDIEGIEFEGNYLKVSISKLIGKYYSTETIINLNRVEVKDIKIINGEIEVTFGGIEIDTTKFEKESDEEQVEFIEAKIMDETTEEIALTLAEIEEYKDEFDENTFFDKIKNYGKTAGVSVIYGALILYYTYKDTNVPLKAKIISLGALGYFILPTDLIPDIMILTGFSDDLLALITAIKSITDYINDDIKLKAKNRLTEWFENIDENELEKINLYT